MTVNSLEERKRYINEIKASFQDPTKSSRYSDVGQKEETPPAETGMFKFKLLLAVVIFGAFVYCDQNQVKIYGKTTEMVYEQIEQGVSAEDVVQTFKNILPE